MHSPCDLRSPDSLRFVCDPRGGEVDRVSNLDIGSPPPPPTASLPRPSPSLLARTDPLHLQEGAPPERVSAGGRKDTGEFGRQRKRRWVDTPVCRGRDPHTHTHAAW